MRLSIIIPAHNGARFLAETLQSALSQSREADEVVLIDDASTDATREIAHASAFRDRVRYVYNASPSGFVDAWNRAAAQATGELVTILHQDDLLDPGYLAAAEQAFKRYRSIQHLYCACRYIDHAGSVIRAPASANPEPVLYRGKEYAHNYLTGVLRNEHLHRCPGVITSRELLLQKCRYRKEAGHIADDDFFLRVGAFTDVVGISSPLASFRMHEESATGKLPLLSLQLAEDYLFQSRYHLTNRTLLDAADVQRIHKQTARFINLSLCHALNLKRDDWVRRTLSLRAEFEEMLPGFMSGALPLWARGLWRMAGSLGTGLPARLYAGTVATTVALRDGFRRALR